MLDQDVVLQNTLQLWANSLINRAKLTVKGDFIAQVNKDIELNGQADIQGTAGFIAEGISSNQGNLSAESIYMQAQKGDISLYRAMLQATMDVKIIAEAGHVKKTATQIQADTNVQISAAKNIELRALATRTGDKDNFKDQKEADSITAGNNIQMQSGGHVNMTGVENKAGAGYSIQAAGSIRDVPLAIESSTKSGDKKNNQYDHSVTQNRSHHQAGETLSLQAGGNQDLYGTLLEAKRVLLAADKTITAHEVHDVAEHRSKESSKGGFFGQDRKKKKFSFSALSKGVEIKASESVDIKAGQDIDLTNIKVDSAKINLTAIAGAVRILLGKVRLPPQVRKKAPIFSGKAKGQIYMSIKRSIPLRLPARYTYRARKH